MPEARYETGDEARSVAQALLAKLAFGVGTPEDAALLRTLTAAAKTA